MTGRLESRAQGEAALLVYLGQTIDFGLNRRLRALGQRLQERALPGVREVLPAYACLQVQFDPLVLDHETVAAWVEELCQTQAGEAAPGRVVELPVVYGGEAGPDLPFVSQRTGLDPAEVVRRHGAVDHPCYVVGFTPGFPYLGGLDPALTLPRMDDPRLDNQPGAVAVAGGQTGVYPLGGPGGWWVIGRTPWLLYDPRRDPATLVHAGDLIRFTPTDTRDFPDAPPLSLAWSPQGQEVFEVLHPGALSTVQDPGRWGRQHRGVPVSGALDQIALARANLLVGNDPFAAALEITLLGPRLKALRPLVMALAGADLGPTLDGRPAPLNQALAVEPGQVVGFRGPRQGGARAVLAVANGLASEVLLGSQSTYVLGRMGRPLIKGDIIRAHPGPLPQRLAKGPGLEQPGEELVLRVIPGPNEEFFSPAGLQGFYGQAWRLSSKADRRGARLEGQAVEFNPALPDSIVSEPNTPGVIQVPPGGQPIIMLREQTVGGYAKIATVFGPDLDRLARCQAGQALRFHALSAAQALAEARRLDREQAAWRAALGQ